MILLSTPDRRVKTALAFVGATTLIITIWLRRPRNICSITPDGQGVCATMYAHPLPIWINGLLGMVGALAGWLLAVLLLRTLPRHSLPE